MSKTEYHNRTNEDSSYFSKINRVSLIQMPLAFNTVLESGENESNEV